jgi:hypothetical protein
MDGCGGVAPPVHASSRAPLLLANLLAHKSSISTMAMSFVQRDGAWTKLWSFRMHTSSAFSTLRPRAEMGGSFGRARTS